jgi:hypothetical protein
VSCLLQTLPPREAPARRGRGSKPAAAVFSARSDRAGRRTSTTHGGRRRARTARLTSEASASDDWRAGPAPPTCDARSLSAGREREGWPGRRGRAGEDILAQRQRQHQQVSAGFRRAARASTASPVGQKRGWRHQGTPFARGLRSGLCRAYAAAQTRPSADHPQSARARLRTSESLIGGERLSLQHDLQPVPRRQSIARRGVLRDDAA